MAGFPDVHCPFLSFLFLFLTSRISESSPIFSKIWLQLLENESRKDGTPIAEKRLLVHTPGAHFEHNSKSIHELPEMVARADTFDRQETCQQLNNVAGICTYDPGLEGHGTQKPILPDNVPGFFLCNKPASQGMTYLGWVIPGINVYVGAVHRDGQMGYTSNCSLGVMSLGVGGQQCTTPPCHPARPMQQRRRRQPPCGPSQAGITPPSCCEADFCTKTGPPCAF